MISAILFIPTDTAKAAATPNPITLSYASFYPPVHHHQKFIEEWAAEIEKRTEGRVKFAIYPGSTLVSPMDTYSAVVKGSADIGTSICAYEAARFPIMDILNQPLGIPSSEVGSRVVWDIYKKFKPEEFGKVKVLWLWATDPTVLVTNKSIRTMEDIKGLSLRAVPGAMVDVFKAWGANPVSVPIGETYEALQKGTVNGIGTAAYNISGFKLHDVTRYIVLPFSVGLSGPFYTIMNHDKWNTLPQDVQKIIDEVNMDYNNRLGPRWDKEAQAGIDLGVSKGMKVINLSLDEVARWKSYFRPIAEKTAANVEAKGLPGKKVLGEAYELINKYSK
jgi:TRAP-type C4-dicarboxylate transport system substrate-binding protein